MADESASAVGMIFLAPVKASGLSDESATTPGSSGLLDEHTELESDHESGAPGARDEESESDRESQWRGQEMAP